MNYKCVKSNPITTTFATRINNSADAGAFNTNLIYMLPYLLQGITIKPG